MTSLVTDVEVLCVQLYLRLLLSDIHTSMDLLMAKLSSFPSLLPGPLVSLSVLFLSFTLPHFVSPVTIYLPYLFLMHFKRTVFLFMHITLNIHLFSTLKTETASSSEVVYFFLLDTWHHISEDSFLQNKTLEKLISVV
jgi:hypothetical protein